MTRSYQRRTPQPNAIDAADQALAEMEAALPENAPTPEPERIPHRAEMRSPMRDEDSRSRAARRAAELEGNLDNLEESEDRFYIDPASIPDGWSYEWKRNTTFGQEDPAYQVRLAHTGWEPVPTNRHPTYMPVGGKHPIIERDGMVLMERPKSITEKVENIERRKASLQVRQKEEQLNSAPDGQFARDHKEVRPRIKRSYEPLPIPAD